MSLQRFHAYIIRRFAPSIALREARSGCSGIFRVRDLRLLWQRFRYLLNIRDLNTILGVIEEPFVDSNSKAKSLHGFSGLYT